MAKLNDRSDNNDTEHFHSYVYKCKKKKKMRVQSFKNLSLQEIIKLEIQIPCVTSEWMRMKLDYCATVCSLSHSATH